MADDSYFGQMVAGFEGTPPPSPPQPTPPPQTTTADTGTLTLPDVTVTPDDTGKQAQQAGQGSANPMSVGGAFDLAGSNAKGPQAPKPDETQVASNYAKETGALGTPAEASRHIISVTSPSGQTYQIHKDVAEDSQAFLKELSDTGYKINSVQGYNHRDLRGAPGVESEHGYGTAFDVNPQENPMTPRGSKAQTNLPPNIEEMAARHNLEYGGHFSRPDPMHFEYDPRGMAGNRSVQIAAKQDLGPSGTNPGNIRFPAGATNPDGTPLIGFQKFPTYEAGIQAVDQKLQQYAVASPVTGQPLNTVKDIVSTYSPQSDNNNTARLIAQASQHLNVDPNQPLNMKDPATRRALVEATLINEGNYPKDPSVLDRALNPEYMAANTTGKPPAVSTGLPTMLTSAAGPGGQPPSGPVSSPTPGPGGQPITTTAAGTPTVAPGARPDEPEPAYPTAVSYKQKVAESTTAPPPAANPVTSAPPLQTPPGPRGIGPFNNMNDAYENPPPPNSGLKLQRTADGKFMWGLPSQNPAQGTTSGAFYHPNNDQILDRHTFGAKELYYQILGQGLYNFGAGFNRNLAAVLDLPEMIIDAATGATAAGLGQKPAIRLGTPMSDLAAKLSPPDIHDKFSEAMSFGGGALASSMPFIGGAAAIGSGALKVGGAVGRAIAESPMVKEFGTAPKWALAKEGGGAFGGGLAQDELHSLYKGMTGREGDAGDELFQTAGGIIYNPLRVAAIQTGLKLASKAWALRQAGSAAIKGTLSGATTGAMTPEQGTQLMDGYLRQKMDALKDIADNHIASLGTVGIGESASAQATKASAIKQALTEWHKQTAQEQKILWSPASGTDMTLPRDFSNTQALYKNERAAHMASPLRDPKNFPTELDDLILGKTPLVPSGIISPTTGKPFMHPGKPTGLQPTDTLGNGQDLSSRIGQMIADERNVTGRAPRSDYIGYLERLDQSLDKDLTKGSPGTTIPAIDAYNKAMAYTKARKEIANNPDVRAFMAGKNGDAIKLDQLLRQGPEGADAAQRLMTAANAKYGAGGIKSAIEDVIRQKYTDAVAPNGFVNPNAHNKFMSDYGGYLNRPELKTLKGQLDAAGQNEDNLNSVVGFGQPGGYVSSEGRAAARQAQTDLYLSAPTKTTIDHLEGARDKTAATGRAIDMLDKDPTGGALTGFKHVVAQRILDGGAPYVEKYAGILAAIDAKDPGFREAAHKLTDPTTKGGLTKSLADWALSYGGAQIGEKLTSGAGMGSKFMMASRSAAMARQVGRMTAEQLTGVSAAVIADPAARAAFLRTSSGSVGRTAGEHAADLLLLHAYVPGLALDYQPHGEPNTGLPGSPPGPGPGAGPGNQPWWKSLPGVAPGAGTM